MGINPEKGTKVAKGKKRRTVNSHVDNHLAQAHGLSVGFHLKMVSKMYTSYTCSNSNDSGGWGNSF